MIILLEHPPITYRLKSEIEDCILKNNFKIIHPVEEFLNHNLKYQQNAEVFKNYLNFLGGIFLHHYKVPSNYNIVIDNGLAYINWMMHAMGVSLDEVIDTVKDVLGASSFRNISTVFMVPVYKEEDNIDLDHFQSAMQMQHDFIIKNYLELSDSRRKNKNYHLMAHENNETLLNEFENILSKYPS